MAEDYGWEVSTTERVPRRVARRWMDEAMLAGVSSMHDKVMHLESGRLAWWRIRRRFRRTYGVVATHVHGDEWVLHRVDT